MKTLLTVAILTCLASAEDKLTGPKQVPILTDSQKIELLKSQREFLQAQTQADPYIYHLQQALEEMQRKQNDLLKQLGLKPEEWQVNPATLDIVHKEQPPAGKPESKQDVPHPAK